MEKNYDHNRKQQHEGGDGYLGSGHEVPRAIEHIIDPAGDPEVTVSIPFGAVSRHVVTRESGEIGFLEPCIWILAKKNGLKQPVLISKDGAHNAWPGAGENNVTFTLSFHLERESL